jgi:hypothetical protein
MKKTLTTLTLLTGLAFSSYGQGYIFFDTTEGNPNIAGYVSINGILDTTTDVNLALVNQTLGTTVATLLLSDTTANGDITAVGSGQIYDLSGSSYATGVAGTTYSFVIQGWLGSNSYGTAPSSGTSTPFNETVLSATSIPPAYLSSATSLNIVTVPEPTTLALAGLGAAGLLAFRRRS